MVIVCHIKLGVFSAMWLDTVLGYGSDAEYHSSTDRHLKVWADMFGGNERRNAKKIELVMRN